MAVGPTIQVDRLNRRSCYFLCFKHKETTPTINKLKLKSSGQLTIGITSLHREVTNRQAATPVIILPYFITLRNMCSVTNIFS